MAWINDLTRETSGGAVGQATQFVVGAADESDRQIYHRVDQMYTDWNLKRVYYPPFRPARHTPMEEKPPVHAGREHRLYQMDWLRRVYNFSSNEIDLAFDHGGFLSLEQDPKTVIAMENLDAFPIDLNAASKDQLLRIPGIGPVSAGRILENRRQHSIDNWRDLQSYGGSTQTRLALRRLPRPASAVGQTAAAGLVQRGAPTAAPPRPPASACRRPSRKPCPASWKRPATYNNGPRVHSRQPGGDVRGVSGEPGKFFKKLQ